MFAAALHSVLEDLLSPDTYFRFNPVLPGAALLDEYRPAELSAFQRLGAAYIQAEQQQERVRRLAQVLRGDHYQVRLLMLAVLHRAVCADSSVSLLLAVVAKGAAPNHSAAADRGHATAGALALRALLVAHHKDGRGLGVR